MYVVHNVGYEKNINSCRLFGYFYIKNNIVNNNDRKCKISLLKTADVERKPKRHEEKYAKKCQKWKT